MNVVLSIAGSDSGGGAGIQADLKTFEAHGVFGTTAITSVTAQNTCGVRAIADIPPDTVAAQIDAVFDDFPVAGVKIGMLSNAAIIRCVAERLRERAGAIPVVLDPVMVATSGDPLLRNDAVTALIAELLPVASLVTPNIDEAEVLTGMEITSVDAMQSAAQAIVQCGARAVLLKGGHLQERMGGNATEVTDVLYAHEQLHLFTSSYIQSRKTHGTGCTLSSAITANLAIGLELIESVRLGRKYVHNAIVFAPDLGHGSRPLLHNQQG